MNHDNIPSASQHTLVSRIPRFIQDKKVYTCNMIDFSLTIGIVACCCVCASSGKNWTCAKTPDFGEEIVIQERVRFLEGGDSHWLIDWLIDRSIDRSIDWLADDWLTDWLIDFDWLIVGIFPIPSKKKTSDVPIMQYNSIQEQKRAPMTPIRRMPQID